MPNSKDVPNHEGMKDKIKKRSPVAKIEEKIPRFKKLEKEEENNKLEVDDAWRASQLPKHEKAFPRWDYGTDATTGKVK